MTATQVAPKLISWASDIEPGTVEQAARTARLPFVEGHVALMPDAHKGIGATVGSVDAHRGAIIPAAVGVDIGCGMVATETTLTAADLPDSLDSLMPLVARRIPAGVGKGHDHPVAEGALAAARRPAHRRLSGKQERTVAAQFGTLGLGQPLRRGLPRRAGPGLDRAALRLAGHRQPAGRAGTSTRPRG